MAKVSVEERQLRFCCGINEVGNFLGTSSGASFYSQNTLEETVRTRYTARVATTIPEQKEAIAELRKLKFQPLRRFKGNEGNMITLWYLPPKRKR